MTKVIKILVTGANGQLGSELRRLSQTGYKKGEWSPLFIFTDQAELDITDKISVMRFITESGVDVIINCAAYTAVDRAEDDVQLCTLVNGTAPGVLAHAANETGATLVHISTDYVFDGQGPRPYKEEHKTSPVSVYGKTKLSGEIKVSEGCNNYYIIRTSWLYSIYGNNFPKTILKLAGERESLNVVFDQVGTPTYAADLAEAILELLINRSPYGTYHYSNEGVCSWYDFALEITKLAGLNCKINPVTSEMFPTKAVRPPFSVLNKDKFKKATPASIPHWRDSLKRFYTQLVKNSE